jgi:hypothetical protein
LGAGIKPWRLLLIFDIQGRHFCKPAVAMKTSTSVITALFLGCLPLIAEPAAPTRDPFVRNAATVAAPTESAPKFASICYETFSLDLAEAAALYRQKLNDGKIYAELTARVAKGKAKQESFAVLRTQSGQRANLESISEFIYPTEFARPAPPASGAPASSTAPVTPNAFETRNVGFSLEIEATIAEGGQIVDVRLAPQTVTLVDRVSWGEGASQTELPIFENQRVTTSLTLVAGQPRLACTPSRPPVSKVDADSANRVWFSFVTADIIPVIKE